MATQTYRLAKRGDALQVDIDEIGTEADTDAVVEAVEDETRSNGFELIRATGRFLADPRPGTKRLLQRLGAIARRYGKRFDVGPI